MTLTYAQTRELVERIQFDNAFIFRYSKRAETPAANSLDQIPESVKEERNKDLLAVVDESAHRANDRLVGQTVEILCEGPSRNNAGASHGTHPDKQDCGF